MVPWHLLLALVLVIGSLPNDRFAKAVQELGAVMLAGAAFAWSSSIAQFEAVAGRLSAHFLLICVYPIATALLAVVYGR